MPNQEYEECFDAYCAIEDKIIDCAVYDIFKAGWVASRKRTPIPDSIAMAFEDDWEP